MVLLQMNLSKLLALKGDRESAHHLYPILWNLKNLLSIVHNSSMNLKTLVLEAAYILFQFIDTLIIEIHWRNPDIKNFPISEAIYPRLITLPIWPGMKSEDIHRIIESVDLLTRQFKEGEHIVGLII
ncbi:MAG: DegT/DnrJ/EryC1/StrS family aminotransferase [Ignavibacteriales bacterium]|nr:DegT/DnrJ/EryC1/StrS family aminotransferase [Ignavibacteriales bacterium]